MGTDVGKNIKAIRLKNGMSQAKLSRLSGISQSAISDIENPNVTKRPNTDTIQRIAIALQCTVSDLMGEKETGAFASGDFFLSLDERKLLEDYRSLNEQGKEYIRQTMYMAKPIYIKHNNVSGMEEVM